MGNPLVPQGTLNRLRASVVYSSFPILNVTASFLAKNGIHCRFQNDAGQLIETMTGGVTSPEPYQLGMLTLHILKTQQLAALYKAQIEANVNVGDFTLKNDATTLPDYQFVNGVLQGVDEMIMDGNVPGYAIRLKGIYPINADLYNLA